LDITGAKETNLWIHITFLLRQGNVSGFHAPRLRQLLQVKRRTAGAGVLLAISREFGKSVDWLLTGQPPKK